MQIRNDWTKEEISEIYNTPLLELIYKASMAHREFQETGEVQVCTLLSIKTGACTEDCTYCSQSIRNHTGIEVQALMKKEEVLAQAEKAKQAGSTRFCMGAAWREVRDGFCRGAWRSGRRRGFRTARRVRDRLAAMRGRRRVRGGSDDAGDGYRISKGLWQ